MQILASICQDGLGLVGWWTQEGDDDEDDEVEMKTDQQVFKTVRAVQLEEKTESSFVSL